MVGVKIIVAQMKFVRRKGHALAYESGGDRGVIKVKETLVILVILTTGNNMKMTYFLAKMHFGIDKTYQLDVLYTQREEKQMRKNY